MKKISIATKDCIHLVSPEEVVCCKAEGSFCLIKLEDGKEIKVSKNLNYVLNQFAGADSIMKVHRSWAINKNYFIRIEKFGSVRGGQALLMKGGYAVPIAKKTAETTMNALQEITDTDRNLHTVMHQIFSLSLADRLLVVQRILRAVQAPIERNPLRQIAQSL